jgi:hypothetical protein
MTTLFPPTLDHVPVGFRFRPTDEELVSHYLKNKLLDNDSIVDNVIAEVDVCKYEPWELPGKKKKNPSLFSHKNSTFLMFFIFFSLFGGKIR